MDAKVSTLAGMVDALEAVYGPIKPPVTKPFDIILHENASYLVDDSRRLQVYRALRKEIGNDPEAILEHKAKEIETVIAAGGMLPPHRAAKVIKAARIAAKIGLGEIDRAIAADPKKAKTLLKQFPGVGDPLADKILLFSGAHTCLGPDSNALRVLVRLGFGVENEKNYAKMYRSAVEAAKGEFATPAEAQRAHLLLRHHGQELCKRSAPRCEACPLRPGCAFYRLHIA
jgi:endonuclease III